MQDFRGAMIFVNWMVIFFWRPTPFFRGRAVLFGWPPVKGKQSTVCAFICRKPRYAPPSATREAVSLAFWKQTRKSFVSFHH